MPQFAQLHFVLGLEDIEQPVVTGHASPEKVERFRRGLSKGQHVQLSMELKEPDAPDVVMNYFPQARTAGLLVWTQPSGIIAAGVVLAGVSDEDDERALQMAHSMATLEVQTTWGERIRQSPRPCLAVFHYRPLRTKPDVLTAAASLAEALFVSVGAGPARPLGKVRGTPVSAIQAIATTRDGKVRANWEVDLGAASSFPQLWEHTKQLHQWLAGRESFSETLPGPGATGFEVSWQRMAGDVGSATIRWSSLSAQVLVLGGDDDRADRSAVAAVEKTFNLDASVVAQIVAAPRPLMVSVGDAPVGIVEGGGLTIAFQCLALAFALWHGQAEEGARS